MQTYTIHFAPLQGYTDRVYRKTHALIFGGVDMYYTPFVRWEKQCFRNKDIKDISKEQGTLVIPQLIAATPEEFREIVSLFKTNNYRNIDINMGCPFSKQVRLHRGAGILPYIKEVKSLLSLILEYPEIRFSVKLRLGWEDGNECMVLLPLLNSLPLTHITLHPRLGVQQYGGCTDLEGFELFYNSCIHPLYYNGDICTFDDIEKITMRFPNIKGLMLGRGLLSHPWLATEYKSGKLSIEEKREKLSVFHSKLWNEYALCLEGGEHQLLMKLKTIWDYLLPDASKKCRKKILKSFSLQMYEMAVTELISSLE